MLKLNLHKDPFWLELTAGVRVYVKPLTTVLMNMAQSQVVQQIRQQRDLELNASNDLRSGLAEALLVKSLAQLAILEWQGVMDQDGTATAPINKQTISDLMDIWFIAQDFWKQYTASLELLEAEGNASGHVPSGTTEAALITVEDVPMQTSLALEVK